MEISDQRRYYEILAVVITGIGKFLLMDWLGFRFLYISLACAFWFIYIFYRYRSDKKIISYWGLNTTNFKKSFLELFPVFVIVVGLSIWIGNRMGANILSWNIIPILLIYPIWGIIQQFIMIGIMARNLKDLKSLKLSNALIILITAMVFAIVHYPYNLLIIGTFFLALTYTFLYLKKRNLLVMGIYHGWIGGFFFYTILERDPWIEVFGLFLQ